jgi:hypothetical protein
VQVLKQKRLYESQRDQLYNQQFNVEQTSFAMTSMQVRRRASAAHQPCINHASSPAVTTPP